MIKNIKTPIGLFYIFSVPPSGTCVWATAAARGVGGGGCVDPRPLIPESR